jgi:adenylate cyclase
MLARLLSGGIITYFFERLSRSQFLISKDLEVERQRTEELVKNSLPIRIADRLKAGEKIIAESHGEATVLFADLVGFAALTRSSAVLSARKDFRLTSGATRSI